MSSATLSVPQAAAPVAFSLLALGLTGEVTDGAALVLSMTLAQVVGAIPITRLGKNLPAEAFLRLLVVFRTLALAAIAVCAHVEARLGWLVVLAAVAGSVNGAAYGYLRSLLNHFTPASRMPRALGIASALNETVFVLAPVAASGLGTVSPVLGIVVLAVLGLVPALVIPRVGALHLDGVPGGEASVLSPSVVLWLTCSAAGGCAVGAIEVGAVALALRFGYEPGLAILFTVPLCLAAVAGGIWVSVRNRMASRNAVLMQLAIMTLGSALAALGHSVVITVLAALLMGIVMAPLATYYALVLETLVPLEKRAEVFALLRIANALGVVFASAVLTAVSLSTALIVVTGVMVAITITVGLAPLWGRDPK